MKKLICSLLAATMLCVHFPCYAINTSLEETEASSNILCSSYDGSTYVEYVPDENGYYLKNVEPEKVWEALDNTFGVDSANTSIAKSVGVGIKQIDTDEKVVDILHSKGTSANMRSTYTFQRQYDLVTNTTGVMRENIPIHFTVYMNMTTVELQGGNYDCFLSVHTGPVSSLGSNQYVFAVQSGITTELLNSGATLVMTEIIQLETARSYSIDTSVTVTGWFAFGASIGGEYYLRNQTDTYQVSVTLPIIEFIA